MGKFIGLLTLAVLSASANAGSLTIDCKNGEAVQNIVTLNENGLHFDSDNPIFKDFQGPLVSLDVSETRVELHGRTKGIEAWVDFTVEADLQTKSITITQSELGLTRATILCDEILVNRSF